MRYTLYTDGGSRGNPGPAASGIVIKDEHQRVVAAFGEYLGVQTNNYAEYSAIITALHKAKELGATDVACLVDSKLVAEQLNRNWKVKEPTIQKLFVQAWNALQQFSSYTIQHVYREENTEADIEVNKVLDSHMQSR
jgi:ribonuclease HI